MSMRLLRILYIAQLSLRRWITARSYQIKKFWHGGARLHATVPIPAPERVLLLISGMIGDSVMCSPVIEGTRHLWPEAQITLMGRRHNCELFAGSPCIDRYYEVPAVPFSIRNRSKIPAMVRWLKSNQFDLAIILLGDDFAHLLAAAGIPIRVGNRGVPLDGCLTHAFSCAAPRTWGPCEKLNALRILGFEVREILPRLWVSGPARVSARRKLGDLGLSAGSSYAVIHPFGSEPGRWWDLDRVAELSSALANRMRLASVLIGGPEIRQPSALAASKPVFNGVGRFTISELLSVIEDCSVAITTDSGPFHIAGALRKPIVGLFRSVRPEHAERYPGAKVILGRDAICDKRCHWDRCQAPACRQINSITVAQVLEQVACIGRMVPGSDAKT